VREQPAQLARRVAHFNGDARRRQAGFRQARLHAAPAGDAGARQHPLRVDQVLQPHAPAR
jgi:hypothetical protein